MLPADLISEETIATLFDHLEVASSVASALLAADNLTPEQREQLHQIKDGWTFCKDALLEGQRPERER